MKKLIIFITYLSALSVIYHPAVFASLYEDEIKMSVDMQERLQKELEKVFGKNKVSVLVRVELMIEPSIRDAIRKSLLDSQKPPTQQPVQQTAQGSAKQGSQEGTSAPEKQKVEFLWEKDKAESSDKQGPKSFVLPGFQAKRVEKPAPLTSALEKPVPQEKLDPALLLAAGTVIRKIAVKLSLDETLPSNAEDLASSIISAFVNINAARGDALNMERVSMPSPWKQLIANPETFSQLLQKALLIFSTILIVGLVALTVIFLVKNVQRATERISNAISSGLRERNIRIDGKYKNSRGTGGGLQNEVAGLLGDEEELAPSLGENAFDAPGLEHRSSRGGAPLHALSGAKQEMLFNVGLDQVGKLYHLLNRENPDNIALVISYLHSDVRSAFLSLLPKSVTVEVLNSLASVRFLEPDMIMRLKEELERRLQGAVGGIEQVIELIQNSDSKSRNELMEILKQRNPELAKMVRPKILFFEDISLLKDEELQLLLAAIKLNELSLALSNSSPELTKRVLYCMPKKMQGIMQETMTFRAKPNDEKIVEAQDKIIGSVSKLIREGKIANPLSKMIADSKLLENKTIS